MAVQLQTMVGATFGPSGANHAQGLVPDPGTVVGSGQVLQDSGWMTLTQVASPGNANAATAGVPLGGLYTSTADPAIVYIRTV